MRPLYYYRKESHFSPSITVGRVGQTETAPSRNNAKIGNAFEISWGDKGLELLEGNKNGNNIILIPSFLEPENSSKECRKKLVQTYEG
jgi:hypothetical protein